MNAASPVAGSEGGLPEHEVRMLILASRVECLHRVRTNISQEIEFLQGQLVEQLQTVGVSGPAGSILGELVTRGQDGTLQFL